MKGDKVNELREALKKMKKNEQRPTEDGTVKGSAENNTDQKTDVCVSEDVLEQLSKVEEEAKKNYDHLLRVMAEFDNYKKRIAREKEDFAKFATESVIRDLIVIIDDLQLVESHVDKNASAETKAILDGVMMVHSKLMKIMETNGLKEIEVGTKFDPALHEAIAYVPSEGHEDGDIIEVQRKGYTLNDRLIKPAQVIVSKGKVN